MDSCTLYAWLLQATSRRPACITRRCARSPVHANRDKFHKHKLVDLIYSSIFNSSCNRCDTQAHVVLVLMFCEWVRLHLCTSTSNVYAECMFTVQCSVANALRHSYGTICNLFILFKIYQSQQPATYMPHALMPNAVPRCSTTFRSLCLNTDCAIVHCYWYGMIPILPESNYFKTYFISFLCTIYGE